MSSWTGWEGASEECMILLSSFPAYLIIHSVLPLFLFIVFYFPDTG